VLAFPRLRRGLIALREVADERPDLLRDAAPAFDDVEAKRARAGVAAALFGGGGELGSAPAERVAVGRYEIESRLGAGGMGVVYRAHDPDLERPVAVKLLHADSSTDDKARARMLREARALAKLSHPNVITVYDVGTDDGRVFVAMELVAGRDLRRWLEQSKGAADWREVLELFIAAGRGLAAAHEASLIHRDFKAENVLVGNDGRVRVLDFGLARVHDNVAGRDAQSEAGRAPPPDLQQTDGAPHDQAIAGLPTLAFSGGLTETGALLGTPLYMAPELYAGKSADERSDQFAFCASLYEGLYRQLPFGSRTLAAHVEAVRAGEVVEPPADSPVPASLWTIIARGLAPDPHARHDDMGSLLAALEAVARERPETEPVRASGSRRWLAVGSLVVLAVAGLIGMELGVFAGLGPASSHARGEEGSPVELAAVEDLPEPEPIVVEPVGVEPIHVEPEPESEPEPEPEPEPEFVARTITEPAPSGWCHLHEDHFTLLVRSSARRPRLVHSGQCYTCRVEQRRSRTRSFTPRDCAGYSLCGAAPAGECE
jgi:serine/threonine protein kinase